MISYVSGYYRSTLTGGKKFQWEIKKKRETGIEKKPSWNLIGVV
jgi:hypothetical protein